MYSILQITTFSQARASIKKVIRTNKIIVPKTADNYMEVRHIVLKGTNRAIGRALGNLAQEWLGIKPFRYTDPIYGKANRRYLEKNYPLFAKRLEGIAQAYNLDKKAYLAGTLMYDLWPSACSVVYFPTTYTTNSHPLVARNLDFNTVAFSDAIPGQKRNNDHKFYSRSFVMELHPTDGGYASVGIGSLDLLSGVVGGINERGLVVSMLVDQECPSTTHQEDLIDACGLDGLQIVRLILDTCATVDEAKIALLQNKYVAAFKGLHFQICDPSGRATICEIDAKTFLWRFTDSNNMVQIMTNHAQYLHPDAQSFPASPHPYSSFNRYKKLQDFITHHGGTFTTDDALEAMGLVYGDRIDQRNLPMRTLWTELYDMTTKTLTVRFYLKDGPTNNKTGAPVLLFSEPFTFRLGAQKTCSE